MVLLAQFFTALQGSYVTLAQRGPGLITLREDHCISGSTLIPTLYQSTEFGALASVGCSRTTVNCRFELGDGGVELLAKQTARIDCRLLPGDAVNACLGWALPDVRVCQLIRRHAVAIILGLVVLLLARCRLADEAIAGLRSRVQRRPAVWGLV